MSPLELQAVADFWTYQTIPAGTAIYRQDDPSSDLYIVRSGKIVLTRTETDGKKRDLKPFTEGMFFGEMAIIENQARSETAVAVEESELLILSGLEFFCIVWDYPMLGVKLLKVMAVVMADRLAKASGFLTDMVCWGQTARRRAVSDDLSGVFNRRFLEETLKSRFSRGFSESRKCSLLMIDFDNFRAINGKFGVQAGDAVITNVGAAFLRVVGENHIPARLSGDEFAVLLPDSGIGEALKLADLLREEIASLYLEFRSGFESAPEKVNLTLSIGAAACPDHAATVHDLFEAADRALYRAKIEGRNRVCACKPLTE